MKHITEVEEMRGQESRDPVNAPETPGVLPGGNRVIPGYLCVGDGLVLSILSAFKQGWKPWIYHDRAGGVYYG